MHRDRVEAQDNSTDEQTIVREARERLQQCVDAWRDNHDYAETDIQMRAGDQWDSNVVAQREQDQRPVLTFNRLESYIQQVVGDQRQNTPSIQVAPSDIDIEEKIPGNEQTTDGTQLEYNKSDVLEGIIRQIEYKSRADIARETAFDHAVGNGFGYYRILTDYANDQSFDQEVKVKRIRNPFAVHIDPAIETHTGEDATFAFISDWLKKSEFEQLYPHITPNTDLPMGKGQDRSLWWADDKVRIVEYFRVVPRQYKLLLVQSEEGTVTISLKNGEEEEGAKQAIRERGGQTLRTRTVNRPKVEWRLMNGTQVIEGPKEIPSKYIPIVPVWGREVWNDGQIIYQSLIRHALDPQKNYNYWRSAMTEMVALAPKAPFIGPASAFAGFEDRWQSANIKNWSFIPYNDEAPAPPQRQPSGDVPQGATQEAQSADYDMKATIGMGMEDDNLGQQSSERSGRAIQQRRKDGETGSYVFVDNLNRAIEHEGRIILDMIPRIYDTNRVIRIRQQDGKGDFVEINRSDGKADVTKGQWDVTVQAGPSYQTQREEFVKSLYEASRAYPDLWKVAGDLLVRNMEWPGSDKIAERLKKGMPPELFEGEPGEKPKRQPTPEEQLQQKELQVRELEAKAKMAQAQGNIEREGMKTDQEEMQTQQDAYEKQTEIAQMMAKLAELENKLNEVDIEALKQQTAADVVATLRDQGVFGGTDEAQQ